MSMTVLTKAQAIHTAIIPVAGLGTRTFPVSLGIPKNLLPAGGKPLIQHAVEEALEAGAKKIVIICNPNEESLYRRHFKQDPALEALLEGKGKIEELAIVREVASYVGKIEYVAQTSARGLGDAVLQARDYTDEKPFAVLLPDDYFYTGPNKSCLAQMAEAYAEHGGNIVSVIEVSPKDIGRYGVLKAAGSSQGAMTPAAGLVEKPKTVIESGGSNLAVMGRYIFQPEIMDVLATQEPGAGNEIQLTDAIDRMIAQKQAVYGFTVAGHRFDYGTLDGRVESEALLALLQHPELAAQAEQIRASLGLHLVQQPSRRVG